MPNSLSPKRRWFRFRLRTLLVVMLVVSVALAPVVWKLTQARRRQLVASEISAFGGLAEYGSLDGDMFKLTVHGSQFSDLAPLRRLARLEALDLNMTQVKDLAPLKDLTQFQFLVLIDTQVRDLSPLEGMTQLECLYLLDTPVRDISPLERMTKLEVLWLDGTQVSDLSPLQYMTELKELRLDGTGFDLRFQRALRLRER